MATSHFLSVLLAHRPAKSPCPIPPLPQIHKVPLGAPQQEEYICIVPRHKGPSANTATNAAAGAAYVEMLRGYATPEVGAAVRSRRRAQQRMPACACACVYAAFSCLLPPAAALLRPRSAHCFPIHPRLILNCPPRVLQAHHIAAMECQLMAKRTPGASVVDEPAVGALRVSANGWEPFILEGFEPLLARKQAPPVVAVEWNPAAMRLAGYTDSLAMVQR